MIRFIAVAFRVGARGLPPLISSWKLSAGGIKVVCPGLGRGEELSQSGKAFVSLGGKAHPNTGEDP